MGPPPSDQPLSTRTSAFEASLVRADVAAHRGDHEEALALIEGAEVAAKGDDEPMRARAWAQKGSSMIALERFDQAEQAVETGLGLARDQKLPFEEATLLGLRAAIAGRQGDPATAQQAHADAHAILTRLGVRA